jgi:hypothetical protein
MTDRIEILERRACVATDQSEWLDSTWWQVVVQFDVNRIAVLECPERDRRFTSPNHYRGHELIVDVNVQRIIGAHSAGCGIPGVTGKPHVCAPRLDRLATVFATNVAIGAATGYGATTAILDFATDVTVAALVGKCGRTAALTGDSSTTASLITRTATTGHKATATVGNIATRDSVTVFVSEGACATTLAFDPAATARLEA